MTGTGADGQPDPDTGFKPGWLTVAAGLVAGVVIYNIPGPQGMHGRWSGSGAVVLGLMGIVCAIGVRLTERRR